MDDLTKQEMAGVMEGVKKELEKGSPEGRTIKCPDCGNENPKNCLTCQKCGTRLFSNHKSSEEKAVTKKDKKALTKRASGKTKEKKEAKEVKKVKEKKAKAKPKAEPKEKEYPVKGSRMDKLLSVIRKHEKEGIMMDEISKEMKIPYRMDRHAQELEERKLIKSKIEDGRRVYLPV